MPKNNMVLGHVHKIFYAGAGITDADIGIFNGILLM
jgi:hypothetical protein